MEFSKISSPDRKENMESEVKSKFSIDFGSKLDAKIVNCARYLTQFHYGDGEKVWGPNNERAEIENREFTFFIHSPIGRMFGSKRNLKLFRCPLRVYILEIYILFMVLRFIITATFHIQYDNLLSHIVDKLKPSTNGSKECLRSHELDSSTKLMIDQLIERKSWMVSFVGSVGQEMEASTVLYLTFAMVALTLKISLWLVASDGKAFIIHGSNYLFNHEKAKRIFQSRVRMIIERLSTNPDSNSSDSMESFELESVRDLYQNLNRQLSDGVFFSHGLRSHFSYKTFETQAEFARFLEESKIFEYIESPTHNTAAFRILKTRSILTTSVYLVAYSIIVLIIHAFLISHFISLTTVLQIKQAKCHLWDPASILRADPTFYKTVDRNSELLAASEYEARMIIFKSLITWQSIFWTFALTIFHIIMVCEATILAHNNSISLNHGVLTINHTKNMIDLCSKLLDSHWAQRELTLSSSLEELIFRKKRVIKAISIAYIHFELLVIELRDYQVHREFAFSTLCILSVSDLITAYLISGSGIRVYGLITFLLTSAIIKMNASFFRCINTTREMIDITHRIANLVAKANLNSLDSSYIIGLWRRQLISEREIRRLWSIKLLGLQIDDSNFVSLNSCIIGVGLLIHRHMRYH